MMTTGTELTTAATNLINAVITIIAILWIVKYLHSKARIRVWTAMLWMFFVVCILGVIAHGIVLEETMMNIIWTVLYAFMGFMVAGYVTAVLYEIHGADCVRKAAVINSLFAAVFFVLRLILNAEFGLGFAVFLIYCGCNLPFILVKQLIHLKQKIYFGWFLAGTFFMVAGSILQSVKSIRFHLIWDFNYNAVYHLFVLLFVLFLWKGIQRADAEEMEK